MEPGSRFRHPAAAIRRSMSSMRRARTLSASPRSKDPTSHQHGTAKLERRSHGLAAARACLKSTSWKPTAVTPSKSRIKAMLCPPPGPQMGNSWFFPGFGTMAGALQERKISIWWIWRGSRGRKVITEAAGKVFVHEWGWGGGQDVGHRQRAPLIGGDAVE